jgi:hypothetical protein
MADPEMHSHQNTSLHHRAVVKQDHYINDICCFKTNSDARVTGSTVMWQHRFKITVNRNFPTR